MMVDMGMAITLLTKKWADAHSLAVKEKVAKYILGTNGTAVRFYPTLNIILGLTKPKLLFLSKLHQS